MPLCYIPQHYTDHLWGDSDGSNLSHEILLSLNTCENEQDSCVAEQKGHAIAKGKRVSGILAEIWSTAQVSMKAPCSHFF